MLRLGEPEDPANDASQTASKHQYAADDAEEHDW